MCTCLEVSVATMAVVNQRPPSSVLLQQLQEQWLGVARSGVRNYWEEAGGEGVVGGQKRKLNSFLSQVTPKSSPLP